MSCYCSDEEFDRKARKWSFWALILAVLLAAVGGCAESAHAQDVGTVGAIASVTAAQEPIRQSAALYVIDGSSGLHVNPYQPVGPAPAGKEWVENCIDDSHWAPNPNYRDPAKSVTGIFTAVSATFAPGIVQRHVNGTVAQPAAVSVTEQVSTTANTASVNSAGARDIWVHSKRCTYTARVVPPPPHDPGFISIQQLNATHGAVQPMTAEEVAQAYRDNPGLPRYVGGGLYTVQLWNGKWLTAPLRVIGNVFTEHQNLCFALQDDSAAYRANYCDR